MRGFLCCSHPAGVATSVACQHGVNLQYRTLAGKRTHEVNRLFCFLSFGERCGCIMSANETLSPYPLFSDLLWWGGGSACPSITQNALRKFKVALGLGLLAHINRAVCAPQGGSIHLLRYISKVQGVPDHIKNWQQRNKKRKRIKYWRILFLFYVFWLFRSCKLTYCVLYNKMDKTCCINIRTLPARALITATSFSARGDICAI